MQPFYEKIVLLALGSMAVSFIAAQRNIPPTYTTPTPVKKGLM